MKKYVTEYNEMENEGKISLHVVAYVAYIFQ